MDEKDSKSISSDKDTKESKKESSTPSPFQLHLDTGEEYVRFRQKFWQIWLPRDPPPPARTSLDDAPIIPVATASLLSKLTYSWITEIMVLGYQRTLQAEDLWKLDKTREADYLSTRLENAWARRVEVANDWNGKLESGTIKPGVLKRALWALKSISGKDGNTCRERRAAIEQQWRTVDGRKEPSLAWALNDTFGMSFWMAGGFKVFGDTSQLMGPLIVKAIINFGKERYAAKNNGTELPNIGRGIGLAIGAFSIIVIASVCQHQFFWRSMATGVLARAALIASIYKRGVNLTGKARTTITNSTLVNHIATDVSRVNTCAQWFHASWTAPIQVTVCLIILCVNLGPSALAGFSLFLLIAPLQQRMMAIQFKIRKKSMQWTDKRAKLLLEVLGAMRIVKYFSYEVPFLKRIYEIRHKEMRGIRSIQNKFSASLAFSVSVPVLAATLAFVTYTLTSKEFDIAVVFSSLSLFQLLRQPLMFLPRALSSIPDARNALTRISKVFHAEMMAGVAFDVDPDQESALQVKNAVFEWESAPSSKKDDADDASNQKAEPSGPFRVQLKNISIPRGSLVAIVGPVGSGKSSVLQALVGEMKKITGNVSFGGRVSYCPQTAWIQNATLRNNVLFGQPFDEGRYWKAIENASLLPDLQALPDGDLTEARIEPYFVLVFDSPTVVQQIGEKGINLSGGQKQRVNIARALYFDADICLLDDPLSAVDAYVGKSLFQDAIIGAMRDRGVTVILVTHALHFLSQCDYIYTLDNGCITESGTHQQLVSNAGEFARLDKAFGGVNDDQAAEEIADDVAVDSLTKQSQPRTVNLDAIKSKSAKIARKGAGTGKIEGRLIVKERRSTGSVSWRIYWAYIVAGRGAVMAPLVSVLVFLMQGSQVMNTYTLVWWQENAFHRPNSFYQILYACLGISQAIFTFCLGTAMDYMSFFVSQNLHRDAMRNIFYAPMTFFDTTPTGRILSVMQKDIDTIDNQLAISMRMSILTMASVIGSVLIISILEYYFIIAAILIAILYNYFAAFYRASAREMKRLDAMLRSILYAHFSESLTGLPTIRSYGVLSRFIEENKHFIDLENRALFLTVTNQRWLAIRLDFLGATMVFIVSIFAVVGVSGISPAQIGLVLTYTTSLSQMCSMVTRQSAEVENYMNSVERVVHYSRGDLFEQEAAHEIEDSKPPKEWPQYGAIDFKELSMSYRPGLPNVLNRISMRIKGGEKIGIVGRTGAGKSSLMMALFRIVEYSNGSISIDDIDISTIGLKDLRSKLSIIPQDPLLFSGTIRSNLDPFSLYEDSRLWDALQRSYLTGNSASHRFAGDASEKGSPSRFTLDTAIEGEGANLSVGERSLLSLARALVKDSKLVIMDEATASVDLETDAKIQRTIQTQFKDCTILCIAHRLRTIISYDRILVLDAGMIAEFDTPLALFKQEDGIFRSMCDRSNISVDDIQNSRVAYI